MNEVEKEPIQIDEQRRFLLSEKSYSLINDAQRKIMEATEIKPSVRKIVNEIITPEIVETIIQKFIKRYE